MYAIDCSSFCTSSSGGSGLIVYLIRLLDGLHQHTYTFLERVLLTNKCTISSNSDTICWNHPITFHPINPVIHIWWPDKPTNEKAFQAASCGDQLISRIIGQNAGHKSHMNRSQWKKVGIAPGNEALKAYILFVFSSPVVLSAGCYQYCKY
jgi:hypothetical protein